jgi:hypothetical protein
LDDLKHTNQTKYWEKMIKFNKDNQVFRIAFDEFIEETEEDYQNRIAKEMKRKIVA